MIAGQLHNLGADEVLRRYVLEHERQDILAEAHGGVVGGHYAGKATARRCCILGYGDPHFIVMHIHIAELVMHVRE